MRVEGWPIWVKDGGDCEEVNKKLGHRYSNNELIWPNSAFTREYRKLMDARAQLDHDQEGQPF